MNPTILLDHDSAPPAWLADRMTGYAVGFFFFWAMCTIASFVTAYLIDTRSTGYWWPRVVVTMLAMAALLTLGAMRLVVPTGIRWWPRPRREVGEATITEVDPR